MKKIVLKITGYILFLGLLFFCVRVWDNIEKWSVSEKPALISAENISNDLPINSYMQIEGGRLDITNAYEISLTTRKSKSAIITNYYIPVISAKSKAIYIAKRSQLPTLEDLTSPVNMSGLLLDQEDLSDEMLTIFNQEYQFNSKVFVLDGTFKPQSRKARAKGLLYPFYTIIGMLLIRFFLTKKPKEERII